jgi:branched-chain amino acid aminotransferase
MPTVRIWTFRPDANGRRLQRSAQRLALPELPVEIFVESLKQLIAVDSAWVPSADESSLYFRPFMIGDEAFLGVRGAHKAGYYVIASPAGPYFAKGVAPVSIWLSTEYACSQAAPVPPSAVATTPPRCCRSRRHRHRAAQVLFLDPVEGKYLEELGGMNVFLVYKDGTLVTPAAVRQHPRRHHPREHPAAGRDRMKVEERKVSIDEWKDGVTSGEITEVFACGTAAVVIGQLKGEASRWRHQRTGRRSDHVAAQGTDRHPVRPPAGPPQLAGQAGLIARVEPVAPAMPGGKF